MPNNSIDSIEINTEFALAGESIGTISQNKLPLNLLNVKSPAGAGGTAGSESQEILTISIQVPSSESVADKFLEIPNAVNIGVEIDFHKQESSANPQASVDLLTGIKVVDFDSIENVVIGDKKENVEADPLTNPASDDKSLSISSTVDQKDSDNLAPIEKSIAPETKSVESAVDFKSIVPETKPDSEVDSKSIVPETESESEVDSKSIVPETKSVESAVDSKSIAPETKSVESAVDSKSIVPETKSELAVDSKSIVPETKSVESAVNSKSIAPETESELAVNSKSIAPETESELAVNSKSIAPETESELAVNSKSIVPETKSVESAVNSKSIVPETESESKVVEKQVLEILTAESAESAEREEREKIISQKDVESTEHGETETGVDLAVMPIETPAPKLWNLTFDTGVFQVTNPDGLVLFDFLFDGGDYQGELGIFNLEGMKDFSSQEDFIKEAARRAASNSAEGYVVINDSNEGARFSGKVNYEDNYNKGNYQGIKTFTMKSGDKFAVMLVPNGTVQQVLHNPSVGGDVRPLFSLGTANPLDEFSLRQIADVTGDGSTFAMEDLRADVWTDRDYNDITFKVSGAVGKAPSLVGAIDSSRDWTKTDFGADLIEYAKSEVDFKGPNNTIAKSLSDRVNYSVQRAEILDNYEPEALAETKQWVVGVTAGKSPEDFANLFEAKNLGATGHIPNTYIWELPADVTPEQVQTRLDNLNGVEFAYPLVAIELKPQFTPNDPLFNQQWNLQNTGQTGGTVGADANVTQAWDTAKGKGVVIGIVDDGLQHAHPDLKDRYRADLSRDFNEVNNGVYDSDPMPDSGDGHGTAAAGVAAASGNNNLGISGVAPEASLAGLRLLADPEITDLQIADALSYLNNEIDIYNNSWKPTQSFGLSPLSEYAIEVGATRNRSGLGTNYVFGAGNDRKAGGNVNYNDFANSRHVIAVAAIDHKGKQTDYSEPGASLLVSAYSSGEPEYANFARVNQEIPDDGSVFTSNLNVGGLPAAITDLAVSLNLEHTNNSDLGVFLKAPSGKKVELFTNIANNGNIFQNVSLSDNASNSITDGVKPRQAFQPEGRLSDFDGENPNGIWQLEITDIAGQGFGELKDWSLAMNTNGIATTDLMGTDGKSAGNYTYDFGGTSSAAPLVSGAIALMLEANPTLTRRDIQHILVDTAKPTDFSTNPDRLLRAGWSQNAAGKWVNHKYGFGAIDVAAAVEKAKTWMPVSSEIAVRLPEVSVNAAIPDRGSAIDRTITVDENITVEWAEVMFDATHSRRGDLDVRLVSPDGTESILAQSSTDSGDNFSKWVFTSARNWGESSVGDWKLKVADKNLGEIGTWNAWKLNLFGSKPTVSLVASDPDATEGEDPGEFTITRSGNTKLPLEVNYTLKAANNWSSPEAINGNDYNSLSGSVTIPAGQSSVKIPIQTIDDGEAEWTEEIGMHLDPNDAYQMGTANSDMVKIWDNETPEIRLFAEWYSGKADDHQKENYISESGNLAFVRFMRLGSLATDLTVNYSLSGTATPGIDYEPMSGSIVIPKGDNDFDLSLKAAIDDDLVELEETAILSVTPDANYKIKENVNDGYGSITTTIWDNDGKPTVSIVATDNSASESGDRGQFTITRTGSTANPLTVDYWQETVWQPRAKNSIDYESLPGQIVIPAGASSVTIDLVPIDDSETEPKELARLWIKKNAQYAISSNEGAEVTIIDNDNPTVEWQRQSEISTANYDSSNDIAVDRAGNIYTVGRTSGNLEGNNQGIYDAWISKYNSAGQLIWQRQFGTAGYDAASGVAVDNEGNTYAIGSTDGGLGNTSDRTSWLVKYDANGSQLWKRDLLTPDYDVANGAISISNGSIHIVGRAIGNAGGSGEVTTDAFVAQYDSNGNLSWMKPIASPAWDEAKSVASDSVGNIYIAGSTRGNLQGTNAGDADAWLAKYDSSGNIVWKQQIGTIAEDEAFGVAVSNNGHVYLSGHTHNKLGESFSGNTDEWTGDLNAAREAFYKNDKSKLGGIYYGSADAWIAQFNAVTGDLKWKRQLGTSAYDSSTGVATDIHGNAYITGRTRGKLGESYAGGDDAWLAKYNLNGALQWKRQLGTVGDDFSHGIAVSNAGVYIGGVTSGNIEGNNLGGDDAWIAKLS
jgi:subtilisin-like proprotein convertase family protein